MTAVPAFRRERDMIAPLADGLSGLLALGAVRHVRTLREPWIGLVIPDLLLGCWAADAPPVADARATRIDDHVRLHVECAGPLSAAEVQARAYLSDGALHASLRRLARCGAIVPDGERWTVPPAARSTTLEIIAIEVKMARWREAVAQAERYRDFADRAYVALDAAQVRDLAPLCAAAAEAGVGLILQRGAALHLALAAPDAPPRLTPARLLAMRKLVVARGGAPYRERPAGAAGVSPA